MGKEGRGLALIILILTRADRRDPNTLFVHLQNKIKQKLFQIYLIIK